MPGRYAMKKGKLFVISAPSGAGKTTLTKAVLENLGKKYSLKKVVTYTTRPLREGEINGLDYNHVSVDQFKQLIEGDFFLEWSTCMIIIMVHLFHWCMILNRGSLIYLL